MTHHVSHRSYSDITDTFRTSDECLSMVLLRIDYLKSEQPIIAWHQQHGLPINRSMPDANIVMGVDPSIGMGAGGPAWIVSGRLHYGFERRSDAVLFKLTWGGAL